jgi:trehalose 6-phosphate synthase
MVSNRVALPDQHRAGGLTTAMQAALSESGGLWFGWNGRIADDATPVITHADNITYATVPLSRRDHGEYYSGFANRTLWPLFHFRPSLVDFSRATYAAYERVNAGFARQLAGLIEPGDIVWVHDYHLIPLGAALRRLGVRARIGFFLHTPLPPPELLTMLPVHRELFDALTAYDLVGFQTDGYLKAFRDYVLGEIGGEINEVGMISVRGGRRSFRAATFPVGIDVDAVAASAATHGPGGSITDAAMRLLIGVDRLDYSKGIPERFLAFREMLTRDRSLQRTVSLLQIAPPSREDVQDYRRLKRQLEQLAGSINGEFADPDWTPVRYVNRALPPDELTGLYRAAAVGLVTPHRDGMNLVAMEYVASQYPEDPGVLLLSRFAGAARNLPGAVLVNPNDIEGTADAMRAALTMPLSDRIERHRSMMAAMRAADVTAWWRGFVEALSSLPAPAPGNTDLAA